LRFYDTQITPVIDEEKMCVAAFRRRFIASALHKIAFDGVALAPVHFDGPARRAAAAAAALACRGADLGVGKSRRSG